MAIKVKGLDKALREIRAKGDRAVKAAILVISETADAIDFDAKTNAPESIGATSASGVNFELRLNVKQRIVREVFEGGLRHVIGINADGAAAKKSDGSLLVSKNQKTINDVDAWAEFGTGQSAREILSSPGYTDEMRSIARYFFINGHGTLIGKPFLYPSWIKNTANLVEELESEIKKAIK